MEIATFDYKVHVVLEEIERSCHFLRHTDIFMTLHVYGTLTQAQHDKQETRK